MQNLQIGATLGSVSNHLTLAAEGWSFACTIPTGT